MKRPAKRCGPLHDTVQRAAEEISAGRLVGIPTETYYGLAANPDNPSAVSLLFSVKKRPAHKPILLLASEIQQLDQYVKYIPSQYQTYIETYWPGPLTLIFPANDDLPETLTAGTGTIGIRLTPHPIARELINLLGHPITATSANISNEEPARTADQVRRTFRDKLGCVIDGGPADQGLGSTILSIHGEKLCILREGRIQLQGLASCKGM